MAKARRDAALRKELTPDTVTSMQSVLIEDARDAIADKRWIEAIEFAQVAIDLRGQGRSVADAFVVLGTAAREEANRLLAAGGGEAEATACCLMQRTWTSFQSSSAPQTPFVPCV